MLVLVQLCSALFWLPHTLQYFILEFYPRSPACTAKIMSTGVKLCVFRLLQVGLTMWFVWVILLDIKITIDYNWRLLFPYIYWIKWQQYIFWILIILSLVDFSCSVVLRRTCICWTGNVAAWNWMRQNQVIDFLYGPKYNNAFYCHPWSSFAFSICGFVWCARLPKAVPATRHMYKLTLKLSALGFGVLEFLTPENGFIL